MTSGENFRRDREKKCKARTAFERKKGQPQKKQRILILTEGKKTEVLYLQKLCTYLGIFKEQITVKNVSEEAGVNVSISHVGSAPKTIATGAKKELKGKGDWQKICCVFDRDQHSTFSAAIQQIKALDAASKKTEVKAYVSDICFELWILIHFSYSTTCYPTADDLIENLKTVEVNKKFPFKNYAKADPTIFKTTFPFLLKAKENAKKLRTSRDAVDGGPYTDIDLLIDELLKLIPEAFFVKSEHAEMITEYKKNHLS